MNRNEQIRQPPSLGSNLRYFTNATDVDNFQTLDQVLMTTTNGLVRT